MSWKCFFVVSDPPTILAVAVLSFCAPKVFAQTDSTASHAGIVRGEVVSAGNLSPVPHATVRILGTSLGAIASIDGAYRIAKVPVGHYSVRATALGFAPMTQEIVVSSAHQVVLNFQLVESTLHGDTVTISGSNALDPINREVVTSATPFSIEDVTRYAAAFQDPSRMAENFAGVFGRGTTNNYIVVRGGSPTELLWQLDGIDILNPNHLGKDGTSGGLISAINSNMLGNSDFLTGAFPAQYGTKLSAVFDLHTRDGNAEQYEGMAEISFNGLEGLAEGPLPGLSGSSFLLSYRHSTLAVLKQLGVLNESTLPTFDDAMLKLRLKLSENDLVNVTGIWGVAKINLQYTTDEEVSQSSGMLAGGVDWQHVFSDKWISHVLINHADNNSDEGLPAGAENISQSYNTAKMQLMFLANAANTLEAGISAKRGTLSIPLSDVIDSLDTLRSNYYYAYLNWNWHIIPQVVLNSGIYTQIVTLDSQSSVEPRISLAWSPADEHTLAFSFGVHRQPEPIALAQAVHYVAGYTYRPTSDVLIKIETYLKNYSDVPIHAFARDSYSYLNAGFADQIEYAGLVNAGAGKTYGAELTFLKHYGSGYYITGTASYVRQQFAGSDGIQHWGAFDNIMIMNLLSGYDVQLSTSSMLTLSEKFTIAGGGMYTPYNLALSSAQGNGVLDSSNTYGARNPTYLRVDFNAEFHFNWHATSLTIYASVLNAFNIKNILDRHVVFTNNTASLAYDYDLPILPVAGIRFEF